MADSTDDVKHDPARGAPGTVCGETPETVRLEPNEAEPQTERNTKMKY
ncbi:MAG: hypothetical protein NTW21_13905 [Verrucomicrobia bacterium]|nr:hypothetical protein [Verrucomicrobiota bacterium]